VNFVTAQGSGDYMGTGLMVRNGFFHMRNALFLGGPNQTNGVSATPQLFTDNTGGVSLEYVVDSLFFSRRGIVSRGGGDWTIKWGYEQGGITPFLIVGGLISPGNLGAVSI